LTEPLHVGVAELKVSGNSDHLISFGLGSCVAVAIFDPVIRVGGLAHVMLPESRGREPETMPGKFADTAVPRLVEQLIELGARQKRLRCKLAGGAQMFEIPGAKSRDGVYACGPYTHIGERNVEAVKLALEEMKIPVVSEDTGGRHGRTVRFDTWSGSLEVSSIFHGRNVL
jgi:chemotaxis protein CheD